MQYLHIAIDRNNTRPGREADDEITAKTLAALHRFQQIGIRLIGELEIDESGVSRSAKVFDDQWECD